MSAQGIIFDVDGTLVDTNRYHVRAWKQTFAAAGHEVEEDDIAIHIGEGGAMLIEGILGKDAARAIGHDLDQKVEQEFLTVLSGVSVELFPDALPLLQDLRSLKKTIAVVTSSSSREFRAVEERIGVKFQEYIDTVITADDVHESKPSPDGILLAMHKMNIVPASCVVVGDSIYDGIAASAAGVSFIGVESGYWEREELVEAGANAVYSSLLDMRDSIATLL